MKYEDQVAKRLLANELRMERKILRDLTKALETIDGKMAIIYNKYAVKGKLTNAEMTKYNRYASMEKDLFKVIGQTTGQNVRDLNRLLPEQYEQSFFQHAWAMDNANGVRINYGTVNPDVMKGVTQNPWLVSAEEQYKLSGKKYLRNAMNTDLTLGKSYTAMSRDLQKAVNRLRYEIVRMVRTEGQSAVNAGQSALYEKALEKGINGYQVWDATLDGDTRPDHAEADQQIKIDNEYYLIGGERARYPLDPALSAEQRINCRCEERFQVEGYSPQLRRSREQGVIPYQKYDEWEKNYGKPRSRK